MQHDQISAFEASLIGRACVIGRREYDWTFDLSDGVDLAVSAPWRIVFGGRIAFASNDDGHLFGLKSPVDGEAEARKLLGSKVITAATVAKETGDLALHFEAETRIDVFNNSMGYEGWQANCVLQGERWQLIAMGGGKIAFI